MRPTALADLDEQLGGQEGAARLHAHAVEGPAAEELAGAVGVAHGEPEEEAQAGPVDARVGQPDGGVRAPDAIAGHDVRGSPPARPASLQPRQQEGQVRDAELAVAVGEADERVARRPEARADGRPVALVHRVVDDAHDVGVLGGQAVGDLGRAVRAAVVDADDLEALRQRGQLGERLRHERLDVLGLVVRGEEVAQGRRRARLPGGRDGRLPRRARRACRRPSRGSCRPASWGTP